MTPDIDFEFDFVTDWPRIFLVALVVIVGAAFIIGGATSGVAFDAFNPEWDGTNSLQATAEDAGSEPVIVRNTTRYTQYGANTTAFVLAPDEPYTEADAARVQAFVERGGTLVIADRDGPHGPDLLTAIGADAQPIGPLLRDERHYHRSPALPVATEVTEHHFTDGVESVTLNYGTALAPGDATVLVASSPYSYLDRDGSGTLSENETLTSYPVATVESVGDGEVVTVSDPSVFINVMQEQDGNRAFSRALVLGTNHTLIDISRVGSPPPLVALVLTIRDSLLLQIGLGIGGLGLLRVGSNYFAASRP